MFVTTCSLPAKLTGTENYSLYIDTKVGSIRRGTSNSFHDKVIHAALPVRSGEELDCISGSGTASGKSLQEKHKIPIYCHCRK